MKRSLITLALALAVLQGCGGGSDSVTPTPDPTPPPYPVQAGDFELIAGTLDVSAPAGAPLCQNGPALGANVADLSSGFEAVGSNGHLYVLTMGCHDGPTPYSTYNLIDIDLSTGRMTAQPVPYDPAPNGPALTQMFAPAWIAAASDGSVLIADRGNISWSNNGPQPGGIWRFKNGALSKVAGFDLPVSPISMPGFAIPPAQFPLGQDGTGSQATFSSGLLGFCAGPNDTFYLLEGLSSEVLPSLNVAQYRKVSLDGAVQTIDKFGSDTSGYSTGFMCATNQRVFTDIAQGQRASNSVTYGDLVSGQAFGVLDGQVVPRAPSWPVYYGFGDGLFISPGENGGLTIADAKKGGSQSAPWIGTASDSFQLNNMPYGMPMSSIFTIVIDNNNHAYLLAGNALLRYQLPGKVQLN